MFQSKHLVFFLLSFLAACGGGAGGGTDEVVFSGTLTDVDPFAVSARSFPGVDVCALGSCSNTSADGSWSFRIPLVSHQGEDILFLFTGSGFETQTVVTGIHRDSRDVNIHFFADTDGSVRPVRISQEGVITSEEDFFLRETGE